jgi:alpha-D-xyloside xylohydrolase
MRDSFQHNRTQPFLVVGLAQAAMVLLLGFAPLACADTSDQGNRFVFERDNRTIVLETFGANILRVTLSSEKSSALASPGYGIVGTPSMAGWTHEQDSAGHDVVRSARMLVRVAPKNLPAPKAMPLDELNQSLRNRYFYGDWGRGIYNDSIFISTTAGSRC